MFAHLPTLNNLRVFEAAARHLSFKLAAEELSLTPTAVSHQIRNLETQLDTRLFIRQTRAVSLTPAGAELAESCRQALLGIAQGIERLGVTPNQLRVSTTHGFAALWLAQRLPDFQQRFPDIRVSVSSDEGLQPSDPLGETDLCIRYGKAAEGEEVLFSETFGIYASPGYLKSKQPQVTLLQTRWQNPALDGLDWQQWQQTYHEFKGARMLEFTQEDHLVQAALAGEGLALASSVLVASLVERGWLKPCLPGKVLPGLSYRLLPAPGREQSHRVRVFFEWLRQQALSGAPDRSQD